MHRHACIHRHAYTSLHSVWEQRSEGSVLPLSLRDKCGKCGRVENKALALHALKKGGKKIWPEGREECKNLGEESAVFI